MEDRCPECGVILKKLKFRSVCKNNRCRKFWRFGQTIEDNQFFKDNPDLLNKQFPRKNQRKEPEV
jgi:hypothetical protein